jgi:hypothetical protein
MPPAIFAFADAFFIFSIRLLSFRFGFHYFDTPLFSPLMLICQVILAFLHGYADCH